MMTLLVAMAAQAREELQPEILERLMAGLAAGDRDSLAALYHRTRAAVYGLALSYLKNGHDAQDVTQDTFVRVWEKAPQYQSKGKPLSWILAIAKNLSLMKLREQGKQQDLEPQEWESLAIDSPDVTWEDRQILQAALNRLSREEQQVVMLHAVAGMRHREIASLLDMPLPTVLTKYHRALKKLNTSLKGDEER